MRRRRQHLREVFVPLAHPSDHAQVDFGDALALIDGEVTKVHLFLMDLPHSDAGFVKACPIDWGQFSRIVRFERAGGSARCAAIPMAR